MNFILESEQRVGSRWVHYLLSDLFGMRPSPEVEGDKLLERPEWARKHIGELWKQNRIPKVHHAHASDLYYAMYPVEYKHLTIVRNPRDRAVSVAFHHKHDPGRAKWPQREMSDEEAVRFTVMEYYRYNIANARMLSNMYWGHSSRSTTSNGKNMWVPYEWLLEDPVREFTAIAKFLGNKQVMSVEEAIAIHDFSNKAKREKGEEKRDDVWRRKGVNKDWVNWFDDSMIEATKFYDDFYCQKLEGK